VEIGQTLSSLAGACHVSPRLVPEKLLPSDLGKGRVPLVARDHREGHEFHSCRQSLHTPSRASAPEVRASSAFIIATTPAQAAPRFAVFEAWAPRTKTAPIRFRESRELHCRARSSGRARVPLRAAKVSTHPAALQRLRFPVLPHLLTLQTSPRKWVPRPSRTFRRTGTTNAGVRAVSGMRASGHDKTHRTGSIATHPSQQRKGATHGSGTRKENRPENLGHPPLSRSGFGVTCIHLVK
jgi:hypothetical protein